ncbi:hypothetical protein [Streptomyces niveus]|uniref:SMI1/KNR4 family protein n=1 Tax=Streptomyces niveus TaxID=193462 RepID=A0A1U9QMF8_STRNV|nr:hypothetical protein [Streptomyces niveus]AQU65370.1 hypothetical protein BBN63_02990 [Streptomyces niveus]
MSGDRLDAEWVRGWCEESSTALRDLMSSFLKTHGFPPGSNTVTLATTESHQATDALVDLMPIPSDLTTLYWVVREVSLPDVDSGYFIHSPSTVTTHLREYGSVQVEGDDSALVFASDGGGHLFAVAGTGRVWRSTTASWFDDFEVVAAGLEEFLEHLGRRITDQGTPGQRHRR